MRRRKMRRRADRRSGVEILNHKYLDHSRPLACYIIYLYPYSPVPSLHTSILSQTICIEESAALSLWLGEALKRTGQVIPSRKHAVFSTRYRMS